MSKLLFLLFTFTFVFGNNSTYIFEAKGQFAEDLKKLIEQYSAEENISVNIIKKDDSNMEETNLNNENYNTNEGKALYESKCLSCHGSDGNKKAYGTSKKIALMSREEIKMAFSGYLDDNYGGKMRFIMLAEVPKTSNEELNLIISYLKSDESNDFNYDSSAPKDKKPVQDTYLK